MTTDAGTQKVTSVLAARLMLARRAAVRVGAVRVARRSRARWSASPSAASSASSATPTGEDADGRWSVTRSPDAAKRALEMTPTMTTRVLLVGEGDFSFTRALVNATSTSTSSVAITATSLESERAIRDAWRGAKNVDALARAPNVCVKHGVDATALLDTFDRGSFDRVCFMFPHIAGKGRINRNRELLFGYFSAASDVLAPGGFIEVALAPGQGGTSIDGVALRDYGNSWQAYTHGAEAGLLMIDVAAFDDAGWRALGYESRGHWRSADAERGFRTEQGACHVFCRESERPIGAFCEHAQTFERDVSLWCDDDEDGESIIREQFTLALNGADIQLDVARIDEYRDPESNRISRTYRVMYTSRTVALTRQKVNLYNDSARRALGDKLRGGAP